MLRLVVRDGHPSKRKRKCLRMIISIERLLPLGSQRPTHRVRESCHAYFRLDNTPEDYLQR